MSSNRKEGSSRPTLQHRLEYIILRCLGAVVRILPRPVSLGLASIVGVFTFDILRIRRVVTLSNLFHAYPEKSPVKRRKIARAAYANLAVVGVEMLRTRYLNPEKILSLARLDEVSEALYHKIMKGGKGGVFVGAHYSTWELLGARVAAIGYPAVAVMQDQRNPLMNRDLNRSRRKLGLELVERRGAGRAAMKILAEGGAFLVLADQDAGPEQGIFIDFFGRPASTYAAPAAFAVRTGAPFVAGWIHREEGHYRIYLKRLDVKALAGIPPDAEEEKKIFRLTETYILWVEEQIRQDPGQYLWLHRRWKTQPDRERK